MNDKTKKILGFGGAIAIALGTGAMFLSGASLEGATGIVGLAFAAISAITAVISGVKK